MREFECDFLKMAILNRIYLNRLEQNEFGLLLDINFPESYMKIYEKIKSYRVHCIEKTHI